MASFVNPIVPTRVRFIRDGRLLGTEESPVSPEGSLDLEAISVFSAIGFFLDEDTYYRNLKVVRPATRCHLDEDGTVLRQETYFAWTREIEDIPLARRVDQFGEVLERATIEPTAGKRIIVGLSGGLDSRTLAAATIGRPNTVSYSYQHQGGVNEVDYGREMAAVTGSPFHSFEIPRGFLWDVIEQAADLNHCYTDVSHARQLAVRAKLATLGDVFVLGHDVLRFGAPVATGLSDDETWRALQSKLLRNTPFKIGKAGAAFNLGDALWQAWGLPGTFLSHFQNRTRELLDRIAIDDPNARLRAFKALNLAPRFTTVNLVFFESVRPICMPYYNDDICRLMANVPDELLSSRSLQIEYIKHRSPALARVPWQSYHPYNLYDWKSYFGPRNLPRRVVHGARWRLQHALGCSLPIQRGWESNFLGGANETKLREHLFEIPAFRRFVPPELVRDCFIRFRREPVRYAGCVGSLLMLSLFIKRHMGRAGAASAPRATTTAV